MRFVRKLPTKKLKSGKCESWAVFFCQFCKKEVKKRLSSGNQAKSCGCAMPKLIGNANRKHGGFGTRLYNIWVNMKRRCKNPNLACYKNYGGRGISVCQKWSNDFSIFKKWALKSGYKDNLSIDRINNDGNYKPGNCRFVTKGENCRNQRTTKLNWEKVKEIRRKLELGYPPVKLAHENGISYKHLHKIRNNERWAV